MSPIAMETYALRLSARTARTDFEAESSVRILVAVEDIVRMKSLRAVMKLRSVSTSNACEGWYCKKTYKRSL